MQRYNQDGSRQPAALQGVGNCVEAPSRRLPEPSGFSGPGAAECRGVWGPHLVVVPTSVMLNWEVEFKKWAPAFKLLTYYGSAKERKLKRQGWSKPNAFHVCVTSYTLILQARSPPLHPRRPEKPIYDVIVSSAQWSELSGPPASDLCRGVHPSVMPLHSPDVGRACTVSLCLHASTGAHPLLLHHFVHVLLWDRLR